MGLNVAARFIAPVSESAMNRAATASFSAAAACRSSIHGAPMTSKGVSVPRPTLMWQASSVPMAT